MSDVVNNCNIYWLQGDTTLYRPEASQYCLIIGMVGIKYTGVWRTILIVEQLDMRPNNLRLISILDKIVSK